MTSCLYSVGEDRNVGLGFCASELDECAAGGYLTAPYYGLCVSFQLSLYCVLISFFIIIIF